MTEESTKDMGAHETSEYVSRRTDDYDGQVRLIQVKGRQTLRVLDFLFHKSSKGCKFSAAQISRILKMPYNTARSALLRLAKSALAQRLGGQWWIRPGRREVVSNVLSNPGKKVSILTGLPLTQSTQIHTVDHDRVPWGSEYEGERYVERHEVGFWSWGEIVDWSSGWPEQKRLSGISLRHYVVKQMRSVIEGEPTPVGGWVWYRGKEFTIGVAKKSAVNLYIGDHTWREELRGWLEGVPNLTEEDLDRFWNAVARGCEHPRITREYHVVDTKIAAAKPELFRRSRPQRRESTDEDEVCILTPTTEQTRSRGLRTVEGRGQRVHEPVSSVRDSSPLREEVYAANGGHGKGNETGIRESLESSKGRVRSKAQGTCTLSGGALA